MEIPALQAAVVDDPLARVVLVGLTLLFFCASWLCMRAQNR
jgi:hypothetical protein